jgi:hypothetical protein
VFLWPGSRIHPAFHLKLESLPVDRSHPGYQRGAFSSSLLTFVAFRYSHLPALSRSAFLREAGRRG